MTAPINDGGAAFARPHSFNDIHGQIEFGERGMSLRAYFAGQVLAMAVYRDYMTGAMEDSTADMAVRYADALIKRLERP